MSILLDALKKSEERRQLGSAPSIHRPPDSGPGGAAMPQQWVSLTLMACSAIAMAWIGWQQYRQPEHTGGPATQPAAAAAERTAGAELASEDGPGLPPAERAASPGREVAMGTDTSAGTTRDAARTPVEKLPASEASTQGTAVLPQQELQQSQQGKLRVNESFAGYEAAGKTAAAPHEETPPAAEAVSSPPPQEATRASAAAQPRVTDPISYWELPQGVRDELPEMRITVLVYADHPEDRFVLMAGQRMVEKDELPEGIVLEEIRRDGVVFLYRKYRFLVKG